MKSITLATADSPKGMALSLAIDIAQKWRKALGYGYDVFFNLVRLPHLHLEIRIVRWLP